MNIAFYAPLKSPHDPAPSGDRQIARNIIAALRWVNASVDLASVLRTYEGNGDSARQRDLRAQAIAEAEKLIPAYEAGTIPRPDAWLTYHSYHKAPDWIGSTVAAALGVPYCLVEASVSPKQASGPWAAGHAQAGHAVSVADLIIGLNPRDKQCVAPLMVEGAQYVLLPPFLDTQAMSKTASRATAHRRRCPNQHSIDGEQPWLLAVGMMRYGDKFQSYQMLAAALDLLKDQPWHLLCVGDGPARNETQALFKQHEDRVTWLGACAPDALPEIYASADVLVWPAINEALGMTILEAAACGLTSVAGHTDGVASLIVNGTTGLIAPAGDVAAFAQQVRTLLEQPDQRDQLGRAARKHVQDKHSINTAAHVLEHHLRDVIARHSRKIAS